MTKIAYLILSFFAINFSFAQSELITESVKVIEQSTSEWQTYYSDPSLTIEYKYASCDPKYGYDNQSILLRVFNSQDEKVKVSWQMHRYYDGKCNTCNYPEEYLYEVYIGPNETIEGDCSIYSKYQLKIFSKFDDENYKKGKKLTSFKLDSLQINQINQINK